MIDHKRYIFFKQNIIQLDENNTILHLPEDKTSVDLVYMVTYFVDEKLSNHEKYRIVSA